jgi:hypothetical protein
MKHLILPTNELIPISGILYPKKLRYYSYVKELKSIQVVPYNGKYLIGDGHNRACAAHIREI